MHLVPADLGRIILQLVSLKAAGLAGEWRLNLALVLLNLIVFPYFGLILVTAIAAILAPGRSKRADEPRSRFLVVVPAHDEESGIAATVRSCLSLDYPVGLFEVLVIADNCSDETAAVAAGEGATVVRRDDPGRKSKGYAIEYLIEQLEQSGKFCNFDALVVIDADSKTNPGLLSAFDGLMQDGHDWIQCFYTVSNPGASWRTRLMTYAFCLFNGVTPLGLSRLGLGAGFRGNGMCFSTSGLRRIPWASKGLVEDMEYSWTVRLRGETIAFVPDVEVSGMMLARGGSAAAAQRKRWEAGRSEIRGRVLGQLLRSRELGVIKKFLCFLELTMPATVTVLAIYAVMMLANLLTILSHVSAGAWTIPSFLLISCGVSTAAILIHGLSPFLVFRLPWNYLLSLVYLPSYAIWKLIVGVRRRPAQWIRTFREGPIHGT